MCLFDWLSQRWCNDYILFSPCSLDLEVLRWRLRFARTFRLYEASSPTIGFSSSNSHRECFLLYIEDIRNFYSSFLRKRAKLLSEFFYTFDQAFKGFHYRLSSFSSIFLGRFSFSLLLVFPLSFFWNFMLFNNGWNWRFESYFLGGWPIKDCKGGADGRFGSGTMG